MSGGALSVAYRERHAQWNKEKLPRWKPRSHCIMNMGLSAKHASTVPLVLNLDTGYINSQFNIVFDDWFATVAASVESMPNFNSPEWAQMFGDSTFQFDFDEDSEKDIVDLNRDLIEALARSHHAVARAMDQYRPDVPLRIPPTADELIALTTPARIIDDDLERPASPTTTCVPNKGGSVTANKGDQDSSNRGA
jgi:hypothetical protein